ncbi:hypothetical protein V1509DRAFT_593780 [Lipomyces kononenkoae]
MQTAPGQADHTSSASPTFTITIVTSTSFVSPQGSSAGSTTSFSKGLIVVFAFLVVMMAVGGCFLFRSGGVTKGDVQWNEQLSFAMNRWRRLNERFMRRRRQPNLVTSDENMEKLEIRDGYIVSRISEDEQSPDDDTSDDVGSIDSLSTSTTNDDGLPDRLSKTHRAADNIWTDASILLSPSGSDRSDGQTKSLTPPPKISTHSPSRQDGYYYVPIAPPHLIGVHSGYFYPLTYGQAGQIDDNSASTSQHQSQYDQGGIIGAGTYNNGYANAYMANTNMPTAYGYYQPVHVPPQYYPYQRAYI